jgi:hypothetical protein
MAHLISPSMPPLCLLSLAGNPYSWRLRGSAGALLLLLKDNWLALALRRKTL